MPRVYIAGPFFNPRQVELISRIEVLCRQCNLEFFSPRLLSSDGTDITQPVPKIGSAVMAQQVFEKDYAELQRCTHMVAVLDYVLPANQELRLIAMSADQPNERLVPASGPLSLPDSGTVWEMGVMYALGKLIVGYTEAKHGNLNLMLTQSCIGVANREGLVQALLAVAAICDNDTLKRSLPQWQNSYR